jgi:hypothetical protein
MVFMDSVLGNGVPGSLPVVVDGDVACLLVDVGVDGFVPPSTP